jgi:hypothetical protein
MSRPFSEIKRQELQDRRDGLIQEYQAASRQLGGHLSEPDRLRIDRDIAKIENDIRKVEEELRTTAAPVPDSQQDVIEVQVAVIAMNQSEAETLEPMADHEAFHQLADALHALNVEQVLACYDERRDDWRPLLAGNERPVRAIITEVADRLNKASAGLPGRSKVQISSLSEAFLSDSGAERRQAWDAMEQNGGVIIVDAISMFHPIIRQHFLNSQLISANNSVGVVVLSPFKNEAVPVNEVLRAQVYAVHLERAFNYFADHWNPLYEFGVADICNLRRWLFTSLPQVRRSGLSPEQRAAIQTQVGVAGRGIGAFISGS